MAGVAANNWYEHNQQALSAALDRVRQALVRHAARTAPSVGATSAAAMPVATEPADTRPDASAGAGNADAGEPPALAVLCERFKLSAFERDLLLLCAGIELDGDFAALCAAAQADPQRPYATFGLALAALPDAHWSALTPAAPLRYWQLLAVEPGYGLVHSPLRIDERVLHYLLGIDEQDERLRGVVSLVAPTGDLAPTHQALAQRIALTWVQAADQGRLPVVHLRGAESEVKSAIAAAACAQVGLALYRLPVEALTVVPGAGPAVGTGVDRWVRLWGREAVLSRCALLVDADTARELEPGAERTVARLLSDLPGPVLLASRNPIGATVPVQAAFDVARPERQEQQQAWTAALGPAAVTLDGQLERIVAQFDLGTPAIRAAGATALGQLAGAAAPSTDEVLDAVWEACRQQARPHLDELAQRIEPAATWDRLVLPEPQRAILHEVAGQVRRRQQVYEGWGFAAQSARGLGISALFAGASGTGKTMAAEVLAGELQLDLYRIDLSAVVSKYIGETEKNLRRIFDAAEGGSAILLFDEADALFGKRSQVKDSHDRYANIEVSYLLQRMEAYRGLAILTTNMKEALDGAFLRRLRFVVHFPNPDAAQRSEIWRQVFPDQTPTVGLDRTKLARLNVAGGNIRNIAVGAAFLAAEAGEQVSMQHLLRATQREYAKLERTLTDAEIRDWVEARPG